MPLPNPSPRLDNPTTSDSLSRGLPIDVPRDCQDLTIPWKYLSLGRSIIPTGKGSKGKAPHLRSWAPYQARLPFEDDILKWAADFTPTSWGMVCGPVSGITVVDCDTSQAVSIFQGEHLLPHVTTPRGQHYYFAGDLPSGNRTIDGIKFEVRGAGNYSNFTGTTPNGQYHPHQIALAGPSSLYHLEDVGKELQRVLQGIVRGCKATKRTPPPVGPVYEGERNVYLTSLAGRLRLTMNAEETRRVLMAVNIADYTPPLDWEEVGKIADSVRRYGYQGERTMQIPDAHLIALSRLSGVSFSAYRVLLEIIRQTLGFGQVKATVWRGNLETATGIAGPHVSRAIRELATKNIIEVETNGKGRNQGPSTFAVLHPDQWKT